MNDYTKPIYSVDGKEFKTVAGLCNHLSKKHDADSVTGVSKAGMLHVLRGSVVVASYAVSRPVIGKPMTLEAA
jgi:hypothetical protein